MMKTKLTLVLLSLISFGLYLLGKYAVYLGFCSENDYSCRADYNSFEGVMTFAFFLTYVTVFSFILNRAYYQRWWTFARFALPTAVVFLVLINLGVFHTPTAGSFGEGDIYNMLFDEIYAFIVYALFVIGSAIVIFLEWRKSKKLGVKAK
jgi:hypothetical protein